MLKRVESPALDPLSLAEIKRHCVVSSDEDADLLSSLLTAATGLVEDLTARQFMTAPWKPSLVRFPAGPSELRMCPVAAVESVKYFDADGVQQPLAESAYIVDAISEPGRVTPAPGTCWPDTQCRVNAVEVEFTAGYGERFDVP